MSTLTKSLPELRLEAAGSESIGTLIKTAVLGALRTADRWIERAQQRQRLLMLDDRMLQDIGISAADAYHEGSKKFWEE